MNKAWVRTGNCSLELLTRGKEFLGVGQVRIDGEAVRSGRLPWRPAIQTFTGHELARLELRGIKATGNVVRVRLKALFRPLFTKLMWDHSTDPIHETGDWDTAHVTGTGELDIVFAPASDRLGGARFQGFAFHYEYRSRSTPVYFLYDMASWEIGGDIAGATVYSQSSCSDPVVTFRKNTAWSTEGLIHWDDANSRANRVMTHNLPRQV